RAAFTLASPERSHPIIYLLSSPDTPTPDLHTLSLHDALPIYGYDDALAADHLSAVQDHAVRAGGWLEPDHGHPGGQFRHPLGGQIGKHTSELQSREKLVCRLLLEKKNQ